MSYHGYFLQAGAIWQDYFDGKITMGLRDAKLRALKAEWGIR